jgi:hypothetical protein
LYEYVGLTKTFDSIQLGQIVDGTVVGSSVPGRVRYDFFDSQSQYLAPPSTMAMDGDDH